MSSSEGYQVNLEFFQGPLDLLLFLIRKRKIDINDIPIAAITKEYLAYLDQKEKINLNREAEFLYIASLLIYIKSQVLLPRERHEEEKDERQVLVDRLQQYQKIKAASAFLKQREAEELKKWKRRTLPFLSLFQEPDLDEISLFDLVQSFLLVMKRREKENWQLIEGQEYSLEDKMKEIISILEENGYMDFYDYFYQQSCLEEAFISFFGLLELIKNRVVLAIQETLFLSIKVWLRKKPLFKRKK